MTRKKSILKNAAGLFLGLAGAAFFGFIPVFAIPLLRAGYSVETVALYRFGLASLALAPCLPLWWRNLSFRAAAVAMAVGLFYFLDVICFFHALKYLPGGVVATLEFLCPVFTVAIMLLFFHEKFRWNTAFAILFALAGVALVSQSPGSAANPGSAWRGIALSLLAAICNALYYIGFKLPSLKGLDALAATFLVMLSCSLLCVANGAASGALQWIAPGPELWSALLLALLTAVLSNLCLIASIRRIGPAPVSILGVMEPVTATLAGIALLGEPASAIIFAGLACCILAVLLTFRNAKP